MTYNQFRIGRAARNNDVSSVCRRGTTDACRRGATDVRDQVSGRVSCMRRRCSRKRPGAMRLRRNAATCLLTAFVGFALLLGGCRTDSTFEFKADGRVRTQIVFEDDTDSMRTLKGNCDELKAVISALGRFLAEAKVENVTRPGGALTCKATSNTSIDGVNLEKSGDSYSLMYKPLNSKKRDLSRISARTTIIMPGKVLKTNAGAAHGNKVVIDGTDYLTEGFQITSEANGTTNSSSRSAGTRTNSSGETVSRHSAERGLPLWMWALIGIGALSLLVGAGAAFTRRKRANPNHANTGFN